MITYQHLPDCNRCRAEIADREEKILVQKALIEALNAECGSVRTTLANERKAHEQTARALTHDYAQARAQSDEARATVSSLHDKLANIERDLEAERTKAEQAQKAFEGELRRSDRLNQACVAHCNRADEAEFNAEKNAEERDEAITERDCAKRDLERTLTALRIVRHSLQDVISERDRAHKAERESYQIADRAKAARDEIQRIYEVQRGEKLLLEKACNNVAAERDAAQASERKAQAEADRLRTYLRGMLASPTPFRLVIQDPPPVDYVSIDFGFKTGDKPGDKPGETPEPASNPTCTREIRGTFGPVCTCEIVDDEPEVPEGMPYHCACWVDINESVEETDTVPTVHRHRLDK